MPKHIFTSRQSKYLLLAAVVIYVNAFIATFLVGSLFSANPLVSILNTYQWVSGLLLSLSTGASISMGRAMTTLPVRAFIPICSATEVLSAAWYNPYGIHLSAYPYEYLIPPGKTYVLTDSFLTVFSICISVLSGASFALLHIRRTFRRENLWSQRA